MNLNLDELETPLETPYQAFLRKLPPESWAILGGLMVENNFRKSQKVPKGEYDISGVKKILTESSNNYDVKYLCLDIEKDKPEVIVVKKTR